MSAIDDLLTREAMIVLAVLGAIASVAASVSRSRFGEYRARQLDYAGYGCMAASMLIFIVNGFRS
ncbi:MAG: hypothetical protein ACO1PN_13045 [Betaproteobacteria bacterium]